MEIENITWPQFLQIINDKAKELRFVPWVENSQSFTKYVVELANKKGGRVVIGFDQNNYQLPGVKFDKRWLSAVIKNECKPEPECVLKEIIRNFKRVYILEVAEGTQKPYSIFSVSYVQEEAPEKEVEKISSESIMLDQLQNESIRKRHKKCLEFLKNNPGVTNAQYRTINAVSHKTAHNELSFMVKSGILRTVGQGRSTRYVLAETTDAEIAAVENTAPMENIFPELDDVLDPADGLENNDSLETMPEIQEQEQSSAEEAVESDDPIHEVSKETEGDDSVFTPVMITADSEDDDIEQSPLFTNDDPSEVVSTSRTELRLSEGDTMASHVNNEIFDTNFDIDPLKIEEHTIFSR